MPKGVYIKSPEHCAALSKAKRGRSSPAIKAVGILTSRRQKGVPLSKKHRDAISIGLCGRSFSNLHKLRLADAGRQRYGSLGLSEEERALKARAARYGLTLKELNAIIDRFAGKCWICLNRDAIDVDHCHNTGVVRGVLCKSCNTALGKFSDNPDRLLRAVEYLGGRT